MPLFEACVDSVTSARAAVSGGAGRLELCSAFSEGGLTPTPGLLKKVKQIAGKVPVFSMIRPRCGDFLYTDEEIELMLEDIAVLKSYGTDGLVFGVLTEDGRVDKEANLKLLKAAKPLPVTFHRAIDLVKDPMRAFRDVIDLGFDRILTSGQASGAEQGAGIIKSMVEEADGRIVVMAGAGVNPGNAAKIISMTGVEEVHGSARKSRKSKMSSANAEASMGSGDDSMISETCSDTVAAIVKAINGAEL